MQVTVLTGGSTPERNVAFAGAAQVVAALRDAGYQVTVVDTVEGVLSDRDERDLLVPTVGKAPPSEAVLAKLAERELGPALVTLPEVRGADLVFPVLHGRQGEGGEVQTLLDGAGVPYAGSGPLGSALAMDKDLAKRLFQHAGVPTADWVMWPADDTAIASLGFPLVVKPSKVGSTVGLTVVDRPADMAAAVAEAGRFDDEVVLEAFLPGREYTVGILGTEALAVGEIIPSHDIFDYECKYTPGMTEEIFPADLSSALERSMRDLAYRAHRCLKLRDFSRVDFRLAADGSPHCLEVNTLPGLTSTSLLPQSAAAVGIPFADLCTRICHLALGRARSRNKAETAGL
ncbi:MAG: D-alanine--D-alanine ligase [Gemmatimonadota bacterium]|nr:D-alanine--D-alanine ligase [Gemmatimonadota bacterium]